MKTKVFIASDHAGFELKKNLLLELSTNKFYVTQDFEFIDLGCNSIESVDYPDFADRLCEKIKSSTDFGVLICGSGQGMVMRANKFSNIRAALVYSDDIAKLAREHNDANVLCLGSRFCNLSEASTWIRTFLTTAFLGGRHQQRVEKIKKNI